MRGLFYFIEKRRNHIPGSPDYSQVGPVNVGISIAPGSQVPLRSGNLGELIVDELHGRYYENTYRKALFNAANQAAVATSAGFATTYTGICLSNPIGSIYNAVILKVGYASIIAQTSALVVGLMIGYNSGTQVIHTTPLTPRNNFVGVGPLPVCNVDAAATLPTAPTLSKVFGSILTGALTVQACLPFTLIDMEGAIILPPGAYAALYTSGASVASSILGSFMWEEVPV